MIEFVVLFWVGALASFILGWVVRGAFQGTAFDAGHAQGVADERAASRKRGQELAEAIDIKQQAPLYTGHWPQ